MLRKLVFLSVVLALALSACSPAPAAVSPTAQATEATEAAEATEAPAATEVTVPTAAPIVASKIPADCAPFNVMSEIFPAPRTDVPAISDKDWKIGSDNAMVKVIVYSDFQ